MKKIKILPDNLINKIAAGEVVERPASVVKELIENSIDANATSIKIEIKDGGKKLIRVIDNGEGIEKDDLFLAFERHATSKIYREEDLYKISTLGFRGEALPSIASVSKIKARAKTKDSDTGYEILLEGGVIKNFHEVSMNNGFIIEVKDLFFNVPVRKKFLKKSETEFYHIENIFKRFSLIYPEIEFQLTHNLKKKYFFPRVKNIISRLEEIYSENIIEKLIPFKVEHEDIIIEGYISTPDLVLNSAREINIFVNKRFVKDKIILNAIKDGYASKISKGEYPYVILNINIPYDKVDVNVHPTKLEIKFKEPNKIYSAIKNSISMLFSENVYYNLKTHHDEKDSTTFEKIKNLIMETIPKYKFHKDEEVIEDEYPEFLTQPYVIEDEKGFFSRLKIIGTLFNSFIILEDTSKVYLIDQHAAHERINFERLKKQIKENSVEIKKFILPDLLEIPEQYKDILEAHIDFLSTIGFLIEKLDDKSYTLKGIPLILEDVDYKNFILTTLERLIELESTDEHEKIMDKILADIACASSIKSNTYLDEKSIRNFLKEFDFTPNNLTCPHGRPIIKEITKDEIFKWFKRK